MLEINEDFDSSFASPSEWAAMYRRYGLQLVPARHPVKGGQWKMPALMEWADLKDNLIPDFTFGRWYGADGEHARRQNMGIITGRCSGNVFVIDFDDQKGPQAAEWWHGLLEIHNCGIEVETVEQLTGGGGRQKLFRAPADWIAPTNKTSIHIDIRGQGGFAMMPPSRHESGRDYEWMAGCAPWEIPIADAPEWLLEEIEKLVEVHGGQSSGGHARTESGAELDAFGNQVDLRETYMRDLVWAAVIGLRRDCPIPPGAIERDAVWADYERNTRSRIPDDGRTNAERLEEEDRGFSLFANKWRRAVKKWDGKIAEEADKPKPGSTPETPGIGQQESLEVEPIFVGDLTGEPKKREWIVPDWIPKGVVSSLSGDGGMGKTLIAQQLLYATGIGGKWLGLDVPAVRGLGVFCEDDEDELHRRHNSIKTDLGHPIGNPFTDTWIWPRVGYDNLLVTFDRDNKPLISPFFAKVMKHVLDKKIGLLVLDTIADLFGGNEIIRAQVNFFIKATCGAFIKQAKDAGFVLTILLLSHPSQAGRNSGSGESGSTAWNNAVRARLYLTRPEDGLPEQRVLTRKKSNYSVSGDDVKLDLIWKDGVLKLASSSNAVAVKSIENQIIQMVGIAWDAGRPYHGKRGEGMRFLDGEVVKNSGDRAPVEAIIEALKNVKNTGSIILINTGKKRGWNSPE